MTETAVTIKDILLLIQAAIVLGGGFYFAGRLGAKLDALTVAIVGLQKTLEGHGTEIRSLDMRVTKIEAVAE